MEEIQELKIELANWRKCAELFAKAYEMSLTDKNSNFGAFAFALFNQLKNDQMLSQQGFKTPIIKSEV